MWQFGKSGVFVPDSRQSRHLLLMAVGAYLRDSYAMLKTFHNLHGRRNEIHFLNNDFIVVANSRPIVLCYFGCSLAQKLMI